MRRGMDTYGLVLYDLGISQVLLDMQSLKKLENLPIFNFCLCLWLNLIVELVFIVAVVKMLKSFYVALIERFVIESIFVFI